MQPIGISRDSPWTHIAWTQAIDLNFGLLSDFNGDAIRALGIASDFRGFRDIAQRSAFLVDVDPAHEKATEDFLHEELEYVVVQNWNDAERGIDIMRSDLDGRATFLLHPPRVCISLCGSARSPST